MHSFRSNIPREMTLSYNSEIVSPKELFDRLYIGLDPVIQRNHAFISAPSYQKISKDKEPLRKECESYLQTWENQVSQDRVYATIATDDGGIKQWEIKARRNFSPTNIFKHPNICLLQDTQGQTLVFRECRKGLVPSFQTEAHRRFKNKYNKDLALRSVEPVCDTSILDEYRNAKTNSVIFVPEPNVLQALELMYTETDLERISPEYIEVSADDTHLWILRDYKAIARDTGLPAEKFGNYLGITASLGLVEAIDRQLIHYFTNTPQTLGNYDLDFLLHTKSADLLTHNELTDIESLIRADGEDYGIHIPIKEYLKSLKRARNHKKHELERQNITPSRFFEFYSPNIVKHSNPLINC
jgi:hypothetical protein